jgi:hypothetical protein
VRRGGFVVVLAGLIGLAACKSEGEPRFSVTCEPNLGMEQIACKVHNHGTKAGRACFTARVQPEQGQMLVGRRLCTGMLEPGRTMEGTPVFDQLDPTRRKLTFTRLCVKDGQWTCKVDIVETPEQLLENQP